MTWEKDIALLIQDASKPPSVYSCITFALSTDFSKLTFNRISYV